MEEVNGRGSSGEVDEGSGGGRWIGEVSGCDDG